jgi:hypothetical protein
MLISDLREFLDREERDIRRRNYAHAISAAYRNHDELYRSRRREFARMSER